VNSFETLRLAHSSTVDRVVDELRRALFDGEVEATARDLTPSPLPFAPRAVLGVVCLRGRMRTVLDPPALVGENQSEEGAAQNDEAARRLVV
jgi:hypothetical protein